MKEKSKAIKFAFPLYDEIDDSLANITAVYLRVSTDMQAQEGYGLDVQYNAIERYVKAFDIPNPIIFIDDGYTGVNDERPAFKKMLALMKVGRIKFVIAYSLDRVGRTQMLILRFLKEDCVKAGCDFLAVKENVDSRNKQTYMILISILSMFAELDHDSIVAKLTLGREQRASEGHWKGGGIPPYGYTYSKEADNLVVEEVEAKNVKRIFDMYVGGGYSPRQIAEILGLSGDTTVFNILKNRTYLGEITFRGKQYKGKHTPLIIEETFNQAQSLIKKNGNSHGPSKYLLSSLLYCGNCGSKMRYMKWGKGKNAKLKILCYSRFPSSKEQLVKNADCPNFVYDAEQVEAIAAEKLMEFAVKYSEDLGDKELKEGDIISILNKRLETLKTEYQRCLNAYRKIGDENILEQAADVDREYKKVERDILEERQKQTILEKINKDNNVIKSLPSTWQKMSDGEKQKIMRNIIGKIVLTTGTMRLVLNKTQYEKTLSGE